MNLDEVYQAALAAGSGGIRWNSEINYIQLMDENKNWINWQSFDPERVTSSIVYKNLATEDVNNVMVFAYGSAGYTKASKYWIINGGSSNSSGLYVKNYTQSTIYIVFSCSDSATSHQYGIGNINASLPSLQDSGANRESFATTQGNIFRITLSSNKTAYCGGGAENITVYCGVQTGNEDGDFLIR